MSASYYNVREFVSLDGCVHSTSPAVCEMLLFLSQMLFQREIKSASIVGRTPTTVNVYKCNAICMFMVPVVSTAEKVGGTSCSSIIT